MERFVKYTWVAVVIVMSFVVVCKHQKGEATEREECLESTTLIFNQSEH